MSYLNSILSSIGGNEQPPKATTIKPPSRTASPLPRSNGASIRDDASPVSLPSKRKAPIDEQLCNKAEKVPRVETKQSSTPQAATAALSRQDAGATVETSSGATVSRSNISGQAKTKPSNKTNTSAGAGRLPTSPAVASPAPKKGSFADIMARAAAAQKANIAKPSLGTIRHKTTEKLSAQDKKVRLEQLKHRKLGGKDHRSGSRPSSRSQSPEKEKVGVASVPKPKKTSIDTGYKGTMRPSAPAAPAYKGTIRGGPPVARQHTNPKARHSSYADFSEEDLDESDGYDDLSDMEAGMDEMDEEEAASLALARREDLEAKREEDRHRREKERRKNLLLKR